MSRIGVLGAGSWGTALAVHFAVAGHEVKLWARDADLCESIRSAGMNSRYLDQVPLPTNLSVTAEMEDLADSDDLLVVVPSHGFRAVLRQFLRMRTITDPATVISATKGIETDSLARMSQVVFEEGVAADVETRFAALSGPTFAIELAAGTPSAAVIASEEVGLSSELRERLSTQTLRLYSSADVVGVEIGGATKNVVAIAAGILVGSGYGHNTRAALITRGLHEITRLGVAAGGRARTFSGLAGLGDLVLTCTGDLSRNRQTGIRLAEGLGIAEISGGTRMVAEGVRNSLSVTRLARKLGVEMPITEKMEAVLYEGQEVGGAIEDLMSRELKSEADL
jgi:glycerol-3-phosphate dehydrogenase (NAD(P)+)